MEKSSRLFYHSDHGDLALENLENPETNEESEDTPPQKQDIAWHQAKIKELEKKKLESEKDLKKFSVEELKKKKLESEKELEKFEKEMEEKHKAKQTRLSKVTKALHTKMDALNKMLNPPEGDCMVWIVISFITLMYSTYIGLAITKSRKVGETVTTEDTEAVVGTGTTARPSSRTSTLAPGSVTTVPEEQELDMSSVVAHDMDDKSVPKMDEGAVHHKVSGSAPIGLFGEKYSRPSKAKRQTLLYSEEVEEHLEAQNPQKLSFLQSSQGMMYQGLLLFVYIHFDAGLPILQDWYKVEYGGPSKKLLFNKQSLLITQNLCEILCLFTICLFLRGSIWDAVNPWKSVKFGPAGACFGIQAVFGFLAMGEMTADCYALYSQSSIVVLTLAWTIFFRQSLSGPCWCGIILICAGMVGFNISDDSSTSLGMTYIALKICTQSFACLYAEKFIKTDPEVLYIQMAWIKPVELLFTIVMMFVIPPKKGQPYAYEEIMTQGFYHDWNYVTVIIMVFNMGDTLMTATIAKKFDSVVKGVAGVFDIIYPTQVLVQFIEPPVYTGLKVVSAVVIFFGSLTFVLSKGEMRKAKEKADKIEELEKSNQ